MARKQSVDRKKKQKKNSGKSAVYIILLIVALAVIAFFFMGEFTFRNDFNSIVNELDQGFSDGNKPVITKCAENLETLKKKNIGKKDRLDPVNDNLLKCYRYLANDPSISHKERVGFLKKMYEISPDSLSPVDKKLVE